NSQARGAMTNHVVRLYAAAGALLVLFLTWAAIAARPWPTHSPGPDRALAALIVREHRVRLEATAVRRIVAQRWAANRKQVDRQKAALAAALTPSVRIVQLPPLTI